MEEVKTTGIFEQKFDLWNKKLLSIHFLSNSSKTLMADKA